MSCSFRATCLYFAISNYSPAHPLLAMSIIISAPKMTIHGTNEHSVSYCAATNPFKDNQSGLFLRCNTDPIISTWPQPESKLQHLSSKML
jgi:hypothetical protein